MVSPPRSEWKLKITKGIINSIYVYFPWGCAGLCWVRILYRTWPIFPLTREEWLRGNDIGVMFDTDVEIEADSPEVILQSYNEDDVFEHHPIITITMNKSTYSPLLTKFLSQITK